MPTKTKIAGIEFDSYIFNASGIKDGTFEELEEIGNSKSSAIMLKSCTIEPRKGNEEPREVKLPFGYFQSEGLPNLGYKKYLEFIPKLKQYKKPIIASVVGFSLEEYRVLVKAFQESEVDLIEINLSCPNIVEQGLPIIYDFEKIKELLDKVSNLGEKPIGLKLPAYLCYVLQEKMVDLIKQYNIPFIASINSVGNTLIIDPEKETTLIKPQRGFGGLSGDYIKPIALGNVRRFYELLKAQVSIIGVGGIKTGQDAFEFLLAGADAVQVGTTFEKQGISCFERINKELEEVLESKNYNSLQEAKGKLRYL
ncbi:dihydroorotate dehydrogenase [Parcubacteria bacterium DG_74_2]|nr:MAG: dihydroorotate dehydrogenase [Parcubacteria bacterium DG_74_2]